MTNKVAILGDTHFSFKGEEYHEYMNKFFKEVFFPYLDKHQISDVIQLGDLFDKHNTIELDSLNFFYEKFIAPMNDMDIGLWCFPGNHDISRKNSVEINAPTLLLVASQINDLGLVTKSPVACVINNSVIALVPWICKDNRDDIMKFLNTIDNKKDVYVFGHFELGGFPMSKQTLSKDDGKDESLKQVLKGFKHVYSGHYHTKSTKGNITYVGTPYELTWADCDDPKGFHILDLDTGELEFIVNPYSMYQKLTYGEAINPKLNCHTRLYVKEQPDQKKLDKYIQSLTDDFGAKTVTVVQDFTVVAVEGEESIQVIDEDGGYVVENTNQILEKYVDENPVLGVDSISLKNHLNHLYTKALQEE